FGGANNILCRCLSRRHRFMIADRQTTRGIDARGRESRIDSEEFAPDDARMAAFQALPERLYRARLPEPVSSGARCLLATRGGDAVARLSVERVETLRGVPGPVGIIGHYEALEAAAGVAL